MNAFVLIGKELAIDKEHANFQTAADDHFPAAILELVFAPHI
jgi:hypothetical protein